MAFSGRMDRLVLLSCRRVGRVALPQPAPLGTVLDSFPSYGSSPSKVPVGTRLYLLYSLCNTHLKLIYKILNGLPVNGGPLYCSCRGRTNCGSHNRHLHFPRLNRFFKFFHKEGFRHLKKHVISSGLN